VWGYVDAQDNDNLAGRYGVKLLHHSHSSDMTLITIFQVPSFPYAQYFAAKQSHPRGVLLPIGYNNPNVMSGIVVSF